MHGTDRVCGVIVLRLGLGQGRPGAPPAPLVCRAGLPAGTPAPVPRPRSPRRHRHCPALATAPAWSPAPSLTAPAPVSCFLGLDPSVLPCLRSLSCFLPCLRRRVPPLHLCPCPQGTELVELGLPPSQPGEGTCSQQAARLWCCLGFPSLDLGGPRAWGPCVLSARGRGAWSSLSCCREERGSLAQSGGAELQQEILLHAQSSSSVGPSLRDGCGPCWVSASARRPAERGSTLSLVHRAGGPWAEALGLWRPAWEVLDR